MKRLCLISILIGIGVIYANSQDSIVSIPDTVFLHALIDEGVDTNGDGLISYREAAEVETLNLDDRIGYGCDGSNNMRSLTGIEAFINLVSLECSCGRLETLDLSNNQKLKYLNCGINNLSSLDISNNFSITELYCFGNQLTSLDVSKNVALVELWCHSNSLTSLDVSNNTSLIDLYCGDNLISTLDISSNTALEFLYIRYMPSLGEICVWETFNPDSLDISIDDSLHICFETNCNGVCDNTGIKESLRSGVSIYPNPTHNLISIESCTSDLCRIEVTNYNGQLILSRKMEGTTLQLDLSSFLSGVYFITLWSENSFITRKIIKL